MSGRELQNQLPSSYHLGMEMRNNPETTPLLIIADRMSSLPVWLVLRSQGQPYSVCVERWGFAKKCLFITILYKHVIQVAALSLTILLPLQH